MTGFEHKFIVQADDIDQQRHVNNVRYVQWIQDVAVAHWLQVASAAQFENLKWVVLRHEIDYLLPAFEGDEIAVRTWVGKVKGARCERFTEIRGGDKILANAKSLWCALDSKTSRPRRVEADLIVSFGMSE